MLLLKCVVQRSFTLLSHPRHCSKYLQTRVRVLHIKTGFGQNAISNTNHPSTKNAARVHSMMCRSSGPSELVKKLWRQLVATCIAFGVRSTENRRFERALELLKRAVVLLSRFVSECCDTHSQNGKVNQIRVGTLVQLWVLSIPLQDITAPGVFLLCLKTTGI